MCPSRSTQQEDCDDDGKRPRGVRGRVCRFPDRLPGLTPGLLKADRTAESFAGLPDGVTMHGQLLAAFKAAAPRLGLSPRLVGPVTAKLCKTVSHSI